MAGRKWERSIIPTFTLDGSLLLLVDFRQVLPLLLHLGSQISRLFAQERLALLEKVLDNQQLRGRSEVRVVSVGTGLIHADECKEEHVEGKTAYSHVPCVRNQNKVETLPHLSTNKAATMVAQVSDKRQPGLFYRTYLIPPCPRHPSRRQCRTL